ncbi:OLC1v1024350C1 [Oldenlandia corymbosa var. corymbosa]|uniref:OLC1v1024350C1 n=1 Tax=Oldenlandia corymbosa var. corymbosa TaxID=529605 RepID=A0AAV1C3U6_OLDCO|nr:OLC1v1024350C1 [Oldenlandia corymbosa var. corymbosa]
MAAAQRYIADINGLISTKSPHFRIVVRVMSIWKMYMKLDQKEIKSLELIFIDAQEIDPKTGEFGLNTAKIPYMEILWKTLLITPHQTRQNQHRMLRASRATRTSVLGRSDEYIIMIGFAFEEIPLPGGLLIKDEIRSKDILLISNNEFKVDGLVNKDWTHMRLGGNNWFEFVKSNHLLLNQGLYFNVRDLGIMDVYVFDNNRVMTNSPTPNMAWDHISNIKNQMLCCT